MFLFLFLLLVRWIGYGILTYASLLVECMWFRKFDPKVSKLPDKYPGIVFFYSNFSGLSVALKEPVPGLRGILLCMVFGGFLLGSLMDLWECKVYRLVWILVTPAAILMGCFGKQWECPWFSWILFCMLQLFWFSKKYGKADCYAFCCSSLVFCVFGGSMKEYLIHMLLSLFLLGIVQLWKHNLNERGNLMVKKPFVPYITLAFLLELPFL